MIGAISLGPASEGPPDAETARIAERVSRYCWAYDERRADLLEECFAEDAVWEGSVAASQAVGPIEGRDRILKWLTGFWPHQHDQRRHMLMNPLVERVSDDAAQLLAYLLLVSARDESVCLETTGFYRVALVRQDGDWRIRSLFGGFDAPFWPGKLESLSERGRLRHGLYGDAERS
jgi:hypothetical protein